MPPSPRAVGRDTYPVETRYAMPRMADEESELEHLEDTDG